MTELISIWQGITAQCIRPVQKVNESNKKEKDRNIQTGQNKATCGCLIYLDTKNFMLYLSLLLLHFHKPPVRVISRPGIMHLVGENRNGFPVIFFRCAVFNSNRYFQCML